MFSEQQNMDSLQFISHVTLVHYSTESFELGRKHGEGILRHCVILGHFLGLFKVHKALSRIGWV